MGSQAEPGNRDSETLRINRPPGLVGYAFGRFPGNELPGYYLTSLRDERILRASSEGGVGLGEI